MNKIFTISIGNDHAGYDLKFEIKKHLEDKGFNVLNYGCDGPESLEYPDFGSLIEQRATATYEYTPNLDYNGQDQFIYQVTDGNNFSQATVFITILNTNDIPTVSDLNFSEHSLNY